MSPTHRHLDREINDKCTEQREIACHTSLVGGSNGGHCQVVWCAVVFGHSEQLDSADLTYANLSKVDARSTGFAKANFTGATTTDWTTDFWTVFRGATWIDGRTCLGFSQGRCD